MFIFGDYSKTNDKITLSLTGVHPNFAQAVSKTTQIELGGWSPQVLNAKWDMQAKPQTKQHISYIRNRKLMTKTSIFVML